MAIVAGVQDLEYEVQPSKHNEYAIRPRGQERFTSV